MPTTPPADAPPRAAVVMGVSGVGKSTVGRALADALGWAFEDADAYHSEAARRKMARGEGLTDADRAPWLDRLAALIRTHLEADAPLVLACSALKAAYRDTLAAGDPRVRFLWLDAPATTLRRRLQERHGHYAGPDLLASQFATLEPPDPAARNVVRLDATKPVEALVDAAVRAVGP